jgi:hypothetical protein
MGFDVVICGAAIRGRDSFFCPSLTSHAAKLASPAFLAARIPHVVGFCATSWAMPMNSLALRDQYLEIAVEALHRRETELAC